MNAPLNIVVDELQDCYIAYVVSEGGVALGMGHTADEAIADVIASVQFCNDLCDRDRFDVSATPEFASAGR